MSWMHTTALSAPAGDTQTTRAFDTAKVQAGSFAFSLSGSTGSPSCALALQGSNAVPPNGSMPGQNAGTGINASWEPPATSWVALGSTPITGTIVANGTTVLVAPDTALLTRWVRGVSTPAAGTNGTMTVEVFLRDAGE